MRHGWHSRETRYDVSNFKVSADQKKKEVFSVLLSHPPNGEEIPQHTNEKQVDIIFLLPLQTYSFIMNALARTAMNP